MLGYKVRDLFRVQGEAWPESFVLDPGRVLGRALCFEFIITTVLGPSRLFGVQGEARLLDQSASTNRRMR